MEDQIVRDSEDGETEQRTLFYLGSGNSLMERGAAYNYAAFNKPPQKITLVKQAVVKDPNANAPRAAFMIENIDDRITQ